MGPAASSATVPYSSEMNPEEEVNPWRGIAAAWERHADTIQANNAPVSEWLVTQLNPQRGQTILEVAAGPGDTGFMVGRVLGDEGHLISSDLAPEMVAVARRRASKFGLSNIEFRTIDAQAIDLPNGHVDGIVCRFGLMLVPDPDAALSECRRVLRPSGKLVFATWGPPERNPWITPVGIAMLELGHPLPGDPFEPGGIFSMSDPERVRALLTKAGFADVHTDEVPVSHRFASFEDYWSVQTQISGTLAGLIAELPDDDRSALKDMVRTSQSPFTDAGGLALPGVSLVASAS